MRNKLANPITDKENERRNKLIERLHCAYIFGKFVGRKGHKTFKFHPDFTWSRRLTLELKRLDAKFIAKHGEKVVK